MVSNKDWVGNTKSILSVMVQVTIQTRDLIVVPVLEAILNNYFKETNKNESRYF